MNILKTIDYDGRACIRGEIRSTISVCSSLMYDYLFLRIVEKRKLLLCFKAFILIDPGSSFQPKH